MGLFSNLDSFKLILHSIWRLLFTKKDDTGSFRSGEAAQQCSRILPDRRQPDLLDLGDEYERAVNVAVLLPGKWHFVLSSELVCMAAAATEELWPNICGS